MAKALDRGCLDPDFDLTQYSAEEKEVWVRIYNVFTELNEKRSQLEKQLTVQRHILHDIASPIAALSMTANSVSQPQMRKIFDLSLLRIKGIMDDLRRVSGDSAMKAISNEKCLIYLNSFIDNLLVEKNAELSRNHANAKITFFSEASGPVFCNADPIGLSRVISNLINNAVDAKIPGIDTPNVELRLLVTTDGWIQIQIIDNGIGLRPSFLHKLGKGTFTFGKTESPSAGEGIGVHSAFLLAESFGGSIAYQSEVGKGTQVSLRLPPTPKPLCLITELQPARSGEFYCLTKSMESFEEISKEITHLVSSYEVDLPVKKLDSIEDLSFFHSESNYINLLIECDTHQELKLLGKHIHNLSLTSQTTLIVSHFEIANEAWHQFGIKSVLRNHLSELTLRWRGLELNNRLYNRYVEYTGAHSEQHPLQLHFFN